MTARQARKVRRAAEREARKLAEKQQISEAKLAANRTGPKSEEGKARSSRNSFKHGLYSKQLVTSGEEAAALDALKADLRAEHQPVNETEEILVNELAEQFWRLRRARALEAALLDSGEIVITHLAAVQRMMSSAERGFHKALIALRQLQQDRGFVPAISSTGSAESAKSTETQQSRDRGVQGTSALARQRALELSAESCSLSANSGFVPAASGTGPAGPLLTEPRPRAAIELAADRCLPAALIGFVPQNPHYHQPSSICAHTPRNALIEV